MNGITVTLTYQEALVVRLALVHFASDRHQSLKVYAAAQTKGFEDAILAAQVEAATAEALWERMLNTRLDSSDATTVQGSPPRSPLASG